MKKIAGVGTRTRIAVLTAIFFLFGPARAAATDFSSSNFTVKDPVLSGGAGYGTSTSFRLWGNVSQIAIGSSATTTFGLRSGFLYFPAPSATPSVTPTPTPSPGGGNIPIPGGGAPPGIVPGIIPAVGDFIAQIVGEPPGIKKCGRSDYNCDGKVNLTDLSIFISYPRRVNTRNLSLVLTDWTDRLIRFRPEPGEAQPSRESEGERRIRPRLGPQVAQVSEVVSPPPQRTEQPTEPRVGILTRIVQFLKAIVRFFIRLIGF